MYGAVAIAVRLCCLVHGIKYIPVTWYAKNIKICLVPGIWYQVQSSTSTWLIPRARNVRIISYIWTGVHNNSFLLLLYVPGINSSFLFWWLRMARSMGFMAHGSLRSQPRRGQSTGNTYSYIPGIPLCTQCQFGGFRSAGWITLARDRAAKGKQEKSRVCVRLKR